jgi:hypothetical protein
MGLLDFMTTRNTFQAQPMQMDTRDYNEAIQRGQSAAIGSLNAGELTGQSQKNLAERLREQAEGKGPSLAQMQLRSAADENIKNQAALIASQRSMNPAQAARAVAMQGASVGQNLANQSAQLRLNEEMAKQQLLAQTLQAQRGQDIAQQGANTQFFGTSGQLGQGQQEMALQNYLETQRINAGVAAQNAQSSNQLLGSLISGASQVGAGFATGGAGAAHGGKIGDLIGPDEPTPADYSGSSEFRTVRVSPGEKVVNPDGKVMDVPGKAKYKGDDLRNDTVVADLRRDAVVIPRTKSGDKQKMIEFLKHVKESSKKKSDLQSIMEENHALKQKLEELRYKMGKYTPK